MAELFERNLGVIGFPVDPDDGEAGYGSTDCGNVSQALPDDPPVHPHFPDGVPDTPASSRSGRARRWPVVGMVAGAKALALTALDLLASPDKLAAAKARLRAMRLLVIAIAVVLLGSVAAVTYGGEVSLTIVNVVTPQDVKIWEPTVDHGEEGRSGSSLRLVNKHTDEHGYEIPAFGVKGGRGGRQDGLGQLRRGQGRHLPDQVPAAPRSRGRPAGRPRVAPVDGASRGDRPARLGSRAGAARCGARDSPILSAGARVFRDNCAVCHGATGDGQGMAAHHFKSLAAGSHQGSIQVPLDGVRADSDRTRTSSGRSFGAFRRPEWSRRIT